MPAVETDSREDRSGDLVGGRYLLKAVVGRGAHAVVYRATDSLLGGDVALKVLSLAVAGNQEFAIRIVREQRAMAALRGSYAPEIYGATATNDGALCLVMELLGGIDLDEHLILRDEVNYPVTIDEVLSWIGPVVETLQLAHDLGIIHRDIKPGNIFIIGEPKIGSDVRVLDFGLAHLSSATRITKAGLLIGSPSYIAPEVWRGEPDRMDQRLDAYSVAAVIYRCLCGQVPFPHELLRDKLKAALGAPRPKISITRPELPIELDDWLARALSIEPEARYRSISQMWDAFLNAVGRPGSVECSVARPTRLDIPEAPAGRQQRN